ncbi:MAG: hypothetical protein ACMUHX_11665 [bacterium]
MKRGYLMISILLTLCISCMIGCGGGSETYDSTNSSFLGGGNISRQNSGAVFGQLDQELLVKSRLRGGSPGPTGTSGPPESAPEDSESGGGPPDGTPGPSDEPGLTLPDYPFMIVLQRTNQYSIPDSNGNFSIQHCPPGDHTINIVKDGEIIASKFVRIGPNQELDLGMLAQTCEKQMSCNQYDGYTFGWADENEDGINDNFTDCDGDGICDISGNPFCHGYGWNDEDEDGINDNFTDCDGDGNNDVNGMSYGYTFGFIDKNSDGKNDMFTDLNGDGICDQSGVMYAHGFGWKDSNFDGINDRFTDSDGDGINDVNGKRVFFGYRFGFVDNNGDGINDNFTDADGDGICDTGKPCEGMTYSHGFGWKDENMDGINDFFTDADGDGVNDITGRPYNFGSDRFGFSDLNGDGLNDLFRDENKDGINDSFRDGNGDGFNDLNPEESYRHGFGFVDENEDEINDNFTDSDGDGVNDITGATFGNEGGQYRGGNDDSDDSRGQYRGGKGA